MQACLLTTLLTCTCLGQTTRPADPDTWRTVLAELQPGDTMQLAPGRYVGEITIPRTAWGTPERPTTIQSATMWAANWQASGGSGDGLRIVQTGVKPNQPHDVVIDGLSLWGGECIGIRIDRGQRITIRNCRVRHFRHNAVLMTGDGNAIRDCLIEACGGDTGGHGIYFSGSGHWISGNVVRGIWNCGIHGYDEGNLAPVNSCVVTGNLIYDQFRATGLLVSGGTYNWIADNIVVNCKTNMTVPDDVTNVIRNNETDLAATGGVASKRIWQPGWAPLDAWLKRMGIETTVTPWPWEESK